MVDERCSGSNGWVDVKADLSSAVGRSANIRWVFSTNRAPNPGEGIYIDDVRIEEGAPTGSTCCNASQTCAIGVCRGESGGGICL